MSHASWVLSGNPPSWGTGAPAILASGADECESKGESLLLARPWVISFLAM